MPPVVAGPQRRERAHAHPHHAGVLRLGHDNAGEVSQHVAVLEREVPMPQKVGEPLVDALERAPLFAPEEFDGPSSAPGQHSGQHVHVVVAGLIQRGCPLDHLDQVRVGDRRTAHAVLQALRCLFLRLVGHVFLVCINSTLECIHEVLDRLVTAIRRVGDRGLDDRSQRAGLHLVVHWEVLSHELLQDLAQTVDVGTVVGASGPLPLLRCCVDPRAQPLSQR